MVDVPRNQTCCGQPAYNQGDRADAADLARQTIDALQGYDYVGGAVGLMRRHAEAALPAAVSRRLVRSRGPSWRGAPSS